MDFNEELIDNLASKLMIGLTREENKMLLDEFSVIESDMELINKIPNIKNVEPLTHPFDLYTATLREDKVEESVSFKESLKNCDELDGREIKVPKTVGEST